MYSSSKNPKSIKKELTLIGGIGRVEGITSEEFVSTTLIFIDYVMQLEFGFRFVAHFLNSPPDAEEIDQQFSLEDLETIKFIGKGSGGVVKLAFWSEHVSLNMENYVNAVVKMDYAIILDCAAPKIVTSFGYEVMLSLVSGMQGADIISTGVILALVNGGIFKVSVSDEDNSENGFKHSEPSSVNFSTKQDHLSQT
ncbi:hypothetical protein Tco_0489967 [Tanacetum coccineum]